MIPSLNVISGFECQEVDGKTHFTGTLNVRALKRMKRDEVQVVLIPKESLPDSLTTLMNKTGEDSPDLLMFVAASEMPRTKPARGQKGSGTAAS